MAHAQFHSIQLNAKLSTFTSLSSDLEKFAEQSSRFFFVFALDNSFTYARLVAYQLNGIKLFSLTPRICLTIKFKSYENYFKSYQNKNRNSNYKGKPCNYDSWIRPQKGLLRTRRKRTPKARSMEKSMQIRWKKLHGKVETPSILVLPTMGREEVPRMEKKTTLNIKAMTIYAIFTSSKGAKDLMFLTPDIREAQQNSKRWHEYCPERNYKVYKSFLDGTIIPTKPIIINGEYVRGAH